MGLLAPYTDPQTQTKQQPQPQQKPQPQGAGLLQGSMAPGAALSAPPPPPFMALDVDRYGQPYYGAGLRGFARKAFAKIFDPSKLVEKPTEEQAKMIEGGLSRSGSDIEKELNQRIGWDKWIGKWTGISAEDFAQVSAGIGLAVSGTDEKGQATGKLDLGKTVKTVAGVMYRGGGQVISGGLEALSLLDKGSRHVQAFNASLDDIGQSSSVIPDLSQADKVLVSILGDTDTAHRLGGLLNALNDNVNPIGIASNWLRAATSGKNLQAQYRTVKDFQRASNMVYTMYWDEAKKDEYLSRVQSGENPDLLVAELQNPWVELAGSVLGDPSTYMGMGIIGNIGKAKSPVRLFGKTLFHVPWETVARLPGFAELVGLKNIGKARLLGSADEFLKVADPSTEKALMALGEAADDADALKKMQAAITSVQKQVREFAGVFEEGATVEQKRKALKGTYGIFSYTSEAKADRMKKTVGTVFQVMAGRFRNPDDILETFKAYKGLLNEDSKIAQRSFAKLKEMYGALPFSHAGMQSMEFMTRLIDEVDVPAMVTKHGGDTAAFVEEAMEKMHGIIDDMFPSVNDMANAWKEVKAGAATVSERQKFLAKSFEDLKKTRPTVVWANTVNNAVAGNKVYRGMQSFYSGTLMGMRPAYAFRNLIQNSLQITMDLGIRAGAEAFTTGVETFARSTIGRAVKQDWTLAVIERESAKLKDILGFIPTEALKGSGMAEKGFGFLAVGQDIEKVHSVIVSRYVVEREMERALRFGGIPDASFLPPEFRERLYTHALESYGDVAKTMKKLRMEMATGFAETWRHLELDPTFKDTLRKSNLLDEFEEIRKTAPDAATFSEQFDAFVKKVDDLAKRTANEPALISESNPMADAVVTVEKAFEEGGRKIMSEEELNQFRALNELRYQLQTSFRDVSQALRGQLTGLLPDVNKAKRFDQEFANAYSVLDNGAQHWRRYADEVYNGVYAASRKGTPPKDLWGKVRTVMLDTAEDGKPVLRKISLAEAFPSVDPSMLTPSEFQGYLWKWFKEQQGQFWSRYTQDTLIKQTDILERMAVEAGTTLDDVKMRYFGSLDNPQLSRVDDLMKQIQDWEQHIDYNSFARTPSKPGEINTLLAGTEEAGRAVKNINAPPAVSQEVKILSDTPHGSAQKLIADNGGVNADEFSDIMSGALGRDKAGVMPGLFTNKGMGLDDAGRLLAEYGYITSQQADDLNFVREFLRKPPATERTFVTEGAKLADMDLSGVPNWSGGRKKLFNEVNAARAAQGLPAYATIAEVPFEEAVQVLKKVTQPIPPYVEGTMPTVTRQLYENMRGGLRDVLESFKVKTLEKWGEKVPLDSNLTDEMEAGLSKWVAEMDKRTISNRAAAASIANETRNFILHDYNKTYADKFASYFLMYHYWPSRTYAKYVERVLDAPGVASTYSKWRSTMEKVHSDQPEFYRYNAQIGSLPGMGKGPFFFNLEATLNPLYGLVGTDFNDPKRRVDWMSSSLDDMGKFGFNLAMPLQWAEAFSLYRKGEDEAARRWLGRLIPATQDIKSGLNLLKSKTGIDLMPDISILPGAKYGEFDPFINLQGGLDAYEDKRVGRALSAMVMNGEISEEQSYDAMMQRSGSLFDEAVYRAINERAPGQVASFFLGVGFKQRTEGDMMVEEFYGKYYKLLAQRENISPDDYRTELSKLKEEYPFADTVLLSARGGDDRDAAYAYNVLSRIPPGDSFKILSEIGLDEETINKFYQSKGDFSEWTPQDRDRFMSSMLDLGATFALPEGATRQEWDDVKGNYQDIRETISQVFGDDIWDKLTTYYDLQDTNNDKAAEFKQAHPEIMQALQLKREMVINDPLVYRYYGSLDTIEAYFDGKQRAYLADKYGADITDKQDQYYTLKATNPPEAKKFLRQHPELKKYWDEKANLQDGFNRAVVDFSKGLPDQAEGAQLREDFTPQNRTQETIAGFAGNQAPTWENLTQGMQPEIQKMVRDYWQNGTELSKGAKSQLDYLAKKKGFYNADDYLRTLGSLL